MATAEEWEAAKQERREASAALAEATARESRAKARCIEALAEHFKPVANGHKEG